MSRLYCDTLLNAIAWKQWMNFLCPLWDKEAARTLRSSAVYVFYSSEACDQLWPLILASILSESPNQPKTKSWTLVMQLKVLTKGRVQNFTDYSLEWAVQHFSLLNRFSSIRSKVLETGVHRINTIHQRIEKIFNLTFV